MPEECRPGSKQTAAMFNLCVEGREHNLAIALAQCHLLKLEVRYCRLLRTWRLPNCTTVCNAPSLILNCPDSRGFADLNGHGSMVC
jgi:hypothetical protein